MDTCVTGIRIGMEIELRDIIKFHFKNNGIFKNQRTAIIKGINMKFRKGLIYGIFGDSGAGKTTLGHIISGYDKDFDGKILLDGNTIDPVKYFRIVFQDPYTSLNPSKDVNWHVHMTATLNGIEEDHVWHYLERVGINRNSYGQRKVSTLSGGEMQRITFSIGVSQNSQCIVYDEPFSYLDTLNIFAALEIIRERKDQIITIYLDNDLNRCSFVSDYIFIMRDGRIVEEGSTEKILYHPEEQYTKMILEKSPNIKKRI
ncbi:ATP-binding cassette domain-containing protein [Caldiplasma sukawensis]